MKHVPHLFLPAPWEPSELPLDESHRHHLSRVLRLGAGSPVTYTDGVGRFGEGVLGEGAVFRGPEAESETPASAVSVAVAPPRKPSRLRFLVEKLAELGVDRLIWLNTTWGEGRPPGSDKAAAWAISALEQSRGAWLMQIEGPVNIDDLPAATLWVAERESFPPPTVVDSVILVIGPEAGFSEGEIPASANRFSLGRRVLRVETAAIAGATLLLERSGRLAG